MGHPLRIYYPGVVYEVTARCLQRRFLLRPGTEANAIIVGVFGRALELFPSVRLHGLGFQSNHYHALISADASPMAKADVLVPAA